MVKMQLNTSIKALHSDRGEEYTLTKFQAYLKSQGTKIKPTTHNTLQHNGIAEQRNCIILERTQTLLHASCFPKMLWAHVVSHVVWLMNQTSSKAIVGKTSFKMVYGKKPDLSGLREWGKEVLVHQRGGDKLGRRAKKSRWIGYDNESNGSQIYYPDTSTIKVEQNFQFVSTSCSKLKEEQVPTSEF